VKPKNLSRTPKSPGSRRIFGRQAKNQSITPKTVPPVDGAQPWRKARANITAEGRAAAEIGPAVAAIERSVKAIRDLPRRRAMTQAAA